MVTANGILVTRGVAKSIFGIQSMLQTNAQYQTTPPPPLIFHGLWAYQTVYFPIDCVFVSWRFIKKLQSHIKSK